MATQRGKKVLVMPKNKNNAQSMAPAKGQEPNTEKRLKLQLPLVSEVYKTNADVPKLTKKMPRVEKRTGTATAAAGAAARGQAKKKPNFVEQNLAPVYIIPKIVNQFPNTEIAGNGNADGAELKNKKQSAVTPVRRIQHHLPGEPIHDVRNHIEERKAAKAAAKGTAAKGTAKATVQPSVAFKPYAITRSEEQAKKREEISAKKASKAASHYFDRYLNTAYDLATTDGVRQLEKFFFPTTNETISGKGKAEQQPIGDNQVNQNATRMLAGGTVIEHRKVTRVAQHTQVQAQPQKAMMMMQMVDTAKAIETRDLRAARQRSSKKRVPVPRRGGIQFQMQQQQQQREHPEQFQTHRPLRFAIRPQQK